MKAVSKVLFSVIGALGLAAGCAKSNRALWSAEDLTTKKAGCVLVLRDENVAQEKAEVVCDCFLDAVSEKYTPEQALSQPTVAIESDMLAMANACATGNQVDVKFGIIRFLRHLFGARSAFVRRSLADDRDATHGLSGGLLNTLRKVKVGDGAKAPELEATSGPGYQTPSVSFLPEDFKDFSKGGKLSISVSLISPLDKTESSYWFEAERFEVGKPLKIEKEGVTIELVCQDRTCSEYRLKIEADGKTVSWEEKLLPWTAPDSNPSLPEEHPARSNLNLFDVYSRSHSSPVHLYLRNEKPFGFSTTATHHIANDTHTLLSTATLSGRIGVNLPAQLVWSSTDLKNDKNDYHSTETLPATATYVEKAGASGKPGISVQFLNEKGEALGISRNFFEERSPKTPEN